MKKNKTKASLEHVGNQIHGKTSNVVALVHQPVERKPLYERYIAAEFENGGQLQLIARKDSIAASIAAVLAAASAVQLDADQMISFKLTYWQLDEDLDDITITVTACDCQEDRAEPLPSLCRRLAAQAKVKFVASLAKQGITLIGPLGELEAA